MGNFPCRVHKLELEKRKEMILQKRRNQQLPDMGITLDELIASLNLCGEDFYKMKLLSRSLGIPKMTMRDVNDIEQLVCLLRRCYKYDFTIYYILMNILHIIQRYDLMEFGNVCKHNCKKLNLINKKWKDWFEAIESVDPDNEESVKARLFPLLKAQEYDTLQQDFLESLDDFYEKSVISALDTMLLDSKPYYSMDTTLRGICVIINNEHFKEAKSRRHGTDKDEERLKAVWKLHNFEVNVKRDKSRKQMISILTDLAQMDHTKTNCIVVCILSHGKQDAVYGSDSKPVKISKDIIPLFYSDVNKTLTGKPKLFFIQACQGGEGMPVVTHDCDSDLHDYGLELDCPWFSKGAIDDINVSSDVTTDFEFACGEPTMRTDHLVSNPHRADDFIFQAVVEGFFSFRNPSQGSYFMDYLVQSLERHGDTHDLQDIEIMVKDAVSREEFRLENGQICKQMPIAKSTLRKKLRFQRVSI